MVMQNERGQNNHDQGERVKIPLLPNNVGKKSVNDAGPKQGHNMCLLELVVTGLVNLKRHKNLFTRKMEFFYIKFLLL